MTRIRFVLRITLKNCKKKKKENKKKRKERKQYLKQGKPIKETFVKMTLNIFSIMNERADLKHL